MRRPTILLTGAQGQIGFELARLLSPYGEVVATDRTTLDLADPDAIVAAVRGARPALVVNAGAYTAVDRAETEAALAHAVNGRAPGILAEEAKRIGALLIHFSTDYVFDGTRKTPYPEDAPTAPLNVYGASKLEGERGIAATGAHAIVLRTSWVYGLRGRNFLLTIRRLAAERDELAIVADQFGVPNWSRTLAEATARIVGTGLAGARGALRALSPLVHRAGKLARLRASDRRRRAAPEDHPDRDCGVSDAGSTPGVWRAGDRALRGDLRHCPAGLAGGAGELPREYGRVGLSAHAWSRCAATRPVAGASAGRTCTRPPPSSARRSSWRRSRP